MSDDCLNMYHKITEKPGGKFCASIINKHKLATIKSKSKTLTTKKAAEDWVGKTLPVLESQFDDYLHKMGMLDSGKYGQRISEHSKLNWASTLRDVISAHNIYIVNNGINLSSSVIYALNGIGDFEISTIPLFQIDVDALEQYCKQRRKKVSAATLAVDVSVMARVIRECLAYGLFASATKGLSDSIIMNHYSLLKTKGYLGQSKERSNVFNKSDFLRVVSSARRYSEKGGVSYDSMIELYYETLLTSSEMLSLKWSSVDFSCNNIEVDGRSFKLTEKAVEILKTLLAKNCGSTDSDSLIFPISKSSISTILSRIVRLSGVDGFQIRDLRRFGAQRLVAEGVDKYELANIMGVRDIKKIEEKYYL